MRQQGGIRPQLYRNNAVRVVLNTRMMLFRVEFVRSEDSQGEDVKGALRFWYVGTAHDLTRPNGPIPADFAEYAANFLRVEQEEEEEEEGESAEASSPFLTRSRARAVETKAHLEMEEVADEFVPDGEEDEVSGNEPTKGKKKRTRGVAGEEDLIVSKRGK